MRRTSIACALLLTITACGGGVDGVLGGDRWQAADVLFHQDPTWLGGEGGMSIDLADGRSSLWLFGDTFIAADSHHTRRASTVVHSSYAVMSGRDPETATMTFGWPLAPDVGDDWLRPIAAVRVPSSGEVAVVLVQYRGGPGEAAIVVGTRVLTDPLGTPVLSDLISDHVVGAGAVVDDDGAVVGLSIDEAGHGNFVTFSPDLRTATFADSTATFRDVPADCTLRRDPFMTGWMLTYANRDGVIAVRTAMTLLGPWSTAMPLWTPPDELRRDATIFSSFAHGDPMMATYVDRPTDLSALIDPARERDVWPHVVKLWEDEAAE